MPQSSATSIPSRKTPDAVKMALSSSTQQLSSISDEHHHLDKSYEYRISDLSTGDEEPDENTSSKSSALQAGPIVLLGLSCCTFMMLPYLIFAFYLAIWDEQNNRVYEKDSNGKERIQGGLSEVNAWIFVLIMTILMWLGMATKWADAMGFIVTPL